MVWLLRAINRATNDTGSLRKVIAPSAIYLDTRAVPATICPLRRLSRCSFCAFRPVCFTTIIQVLLSAFSALRAPRRFGCSVCVLIPAHVTTIIQILLFAFSALRAPRRFGCSVCVLSPAHDTTIIQILCLRPLNPCAIKVCPFQQCVIKERQRRLKGSRRIHLSQSDKGIQRLTC